MQNNIILALIIVAATFSFGTFIFILHLTKHVHIISKKLSYHYDLLTKFKEILKQKTTIGETTEKSEIIYQDLLQDLIPIMAAIDIMPRSTTEHPLWRSLGGIMDEYKQNPFVLEKLRRAIKLDPNIAQNVGHYLNRANIFLQHMAKTDTDGILSTTFTDGLLGQSLTFFAQAQALARTEE